MKPLITLILAMAMLVGTAMAIDAEYCCPVCSQYGLKSYTTFIGTYRTRALYYTNYDDEGSQIDEDPNLVKAYYKCSKGHKWNVDSQYGKKEVVITVDILGIDERFISI